MLGHPRSRVPLGRRAARAAINCCTNTALRRACPSALNLGCPIFKSESLPARFLVDTGWAKALVPVGMIVFPTIAPVFFGQSTIQGSIHNPSMATATALPVARVMVIGTAMATAMAMAMEMEMAMAMATLMAMSMATSTAMATATAIATAMPTAMATVAAMATATAMTMAMATVTAMETVVAKVMVATMATSMATTAAMVTATTTVTAKVMAMVWQWQIHVAFRTVISTFRIQ